MKTMTVYVSEEQKEKLDYLCEKLDIKKSVVLRQGLDRAIVWAENRLHALSKAGLSDV